MARAENTATYKSDQQQHCLFVLFFNTRRISLCELVLNDNKQTNDNKKTWVSGAEWLPQGTEVNKKALRIKGAVAACGCRGWHAKYVRIKYNYSIDHTIQKHSKLLNSISTHYINNSMRLDLFQHHSFVAFLLTRACRRRNLKKRKKEV